MRTIFRWLHGLSFILAAGAGQAANFVTLTFDPAPNAYTNSTVNGIRISPECHIDVFNPSDYLGQDPAVGYRFGNAVGWDGSGCHSPGVSNPDYLGSTPGEVFFRHLYFDNVGRPFSLLAFDYFLSEFGDEGTLWSSKNGRFDLSPAWFDGDKFTTQLLNSPEWKGIKWVVFGTSDHGEPSMFLDNLVFRVSAPGSFQLGLLGWAGLMGFAAFRRRRLGLRSLSMQRT